MNYSMYQNDTVAVSQETLREGAMYNLQLKRSAIDDSESQAQNVGGRSSMRLSTFEYDESELSNDLTGKTLEDEILSFQQGTSIRAMGDNIRRLSISENHRDHPMFYEFEYFNRGFKQDIPSSVFSDEEDDMDLGLDSNLDLEMDRESIFVNIGSKSTNSSNHTPSASTSSMALLLSGLDEDVSMNLDLDDQQDVTGNGNGNGVKKLFKLNKMFRMNNRDLASEDEPEQIFKKKYFWSRKPTVPILRDSKNEQTGYSSSQNPSFHNDQLIVSGVEDSTMNTANVNPIKLVTVEKNMADNYSPTLSSGSSKINSLEPEMALSSNSSIVSQIKPNTTGSTSISSSSSSYVQTPVSVHSSKAQSLSLSKLNIQNNLGSTIIKKQHGVPKTRGRKPSPILDASKPFGCEYCDRRFKRQEHLKRHIRSLHICEKPYGCDICGKKFSRSDNLNQHLKTHTHDQK